MKLIDYIKGRDRRLVFLWMGAIGIHMTGYKTREIHLSPEKQLEVATKVDEVFGADFTYPIRVSHKSCHQSFDRS